MSIHFTSNIIKVKIEIQLKNLTAVNIVESLFVSLYCLLVSIQSFRIEILDIQIYGSNLRHKM